MKTSLWQTTEYGNMTGLICIPRIIGMQINDPISKPAPYPPIGVAAHIH